MIGQSAPARVFIASSSEGLRIANLFAELLVRELGGLVDVRPWNKGTFELTRPYIVSLERELLDADFGVFVLTRDDELISRQVGGRAPRDNVVFELGLFMGGLGRDRTFYLHPKGLRILSDLQGVEAATFDDAESPAAATLSAAGSQVASAIRKALKGGLASRQKLTDGERARQDTLRRFYDEIAGAWWERIRHNGREQALSFFTIRADEVHHSVRLDGSAYGKNGALRARWRSSASRLNDLNVTYVRECKPIKNPKWLPGLGVIDFEPAGEGGRIRAGAGEFWEGDDSNPGKTVIKSVEIRRVHDDSYTKVMTEGSEADKQSLVESILTGKVRVF